MHVRVAFGGAMTEHPAGAEAEPATSPAEPGGVLDPEAPESLTRTTLRGVSLAGGGYVISQLLNFLAYLVLVRLLTPRDFGLYAAGTLITGIGGLFAESGMLAALIKREDRLEEAASTAFATLLITGIGLTLLSLALSGLVGLAFHSGKVGAVTAVLSGWLLVRALTIVPDALLQRRFSFLRRVAVDPLGVVAYAAAAIPLAAGGAGVWAMVAGAYASIVVQAVAAWIASGFRPQRRLVSRGMWRELTSYTRPLVAGEILRRATSQIDVFILGRFSGAATLGQYRNGYMLIQQPAGLFGQVVAYVILPAFARISAVPGRLTAAARRAFWLTSTVIFPISVASIPLGVPVAVALLGERWRTAGHAIAGLSGLVLGGTLLSLSGELMKAVAALRLQFIVHVVWIAAVAVSVTVAGLLWGLLGVSIALSASTCLAAVYAIVGLAAALAVPRHTFFAGMTRPLIGSGLMAGAMFLFDRAVNLVGHGEAARVLLLLAEMALGAIVYCAALAAIDPGRRELGVTVTRTVQGRLKAARGGGQATRNAS
jgi:O-antigen/teichoic acid export membrane protein